MKSLGIFVGGSRCNANCFYCAGEQHRIREVKDGEVVNRKKLEKILIENKDEIESISLSSAGETTCYPESITNTLKLIDQHIDNRIKINLYTNGTQISSAMFQELYVGKWFDLGLTNIYLSLTHYNSDVNAFNLGRKSFPDVQRVISKCKELFNVRVNMVLHKHLYKTEEQFYYIAEKFLSMGVDKIAAWCVRDENDNYDLQSSLIFEPVENPRIEIYSTSNIMYQSEEKMTLFPDGELSNKWCR